jgi:hypothetical protein
VRAIVVSTDMLTRARIGCKRTCGKIACKRIVRVLLKVNFMETADLTHHISRRFNEDLEKVRNQVLQMGGFVEQQLHKAITALVEGDSRLGESVATDDYKVNGMEVSIDEECSRILAIARARGRRPARDRRHHQDHHRSGAHRR